MLDSKLPEPIPRGNNSLPIVQSNNKSPVENRGKPFQHEHSSNDLAMKTKGNTSNPSYIKDSLKSKKINPLIKFFSFLPSTFNELDNVVVSYFKKTVYNAAKSTILSKKTQSDSPSLGEVSVPHGLRRMDNLILDSNISKGEMKELVEEGRKIAEKIIRGEIGTPKSDREKMKDVQKLVWFMTYMAATQGEEHLSGILRIDDPNGKLYKFLNSGKAYDRISTHYEIYQKSGVGQRGFDLDKDLKLPAGKHTVLFSNLPDGTTIVKLEEYGCPPFWKKNFRTKKNFNEFLGHAMNFSKSLTNQEHSFKVDLPARRENIDKSEVLAFKDAMKSLRELDKYKLLSQLEEKESVGEEYGTSTMLLALKEEIKTLEDAGVSESDLASAKGVLEGLSKKVAEDRARGYEGGRQGNEVCLPSFDKFISKDL